MSTYIWGELTHKNDSWVVHHQVGVVLRKKALGEAMVFSELPAAVFPTQHSDFRELPTFIIIYLCIYWDILPTNLSMFQGITNKHWGSNPVWSTFKHQKSLENPWKPGRKVEKWRSSHLHMYIYIYIHVYIYIYIIDKYIYHHVCMYIYIANRHVDFITNTWGLASTGATFSNTTAISPTKVPGGQPWKW